MIECILMKVKSERNILSMEFDNKRNMFILSFIFIINCILLYNFFAKNFSGPYIVMDEPVYFDLARAIHDEFSYLGHNQYNPFYPFIISFFFILDTTFESYKAAIFFNIAIFSSIIFPAYFLCKKLLKSNLLSIVTASVMIMLPWKIVINLIWAEPLYYFLLVLCFYLFYVYLEHNSTKNGIILGICSGLLFMTKQAGIIFIIAMMIALLYQQVMFKGEYKKFYKRILFILLPCMMIMIPWIIRGVILVSKTGSDNIGYGVEFANLKSIFAKFNDFIQAFFYELSYITIATYFIGIVCFITSCFYIRKQEKNKQVFTVLVLFFLLGILFISAVHRINLVNWPFGRYVTSALPFLFILTISDFIDNKISLKKILITFVTGILLLSISCMYSAIPASIFSYGYLNNFDLTIWSDFYNGFNQVIWNPNEKIDVVPLTVALFSFCMLFVVIYYIISKQEKIKLIKGFQIFIFILLGGTMIYGGFRGSYYNYAISKSTENENKIYRYLSENNISYDAIAKDKITVSSDRIDIAWFKKELPQIFILDLLGEIDVDFGKVNSPEMPNTYIVRAPWDPISAQFGFNKILGFDKQYIPILEGVPISKDISEESVIEPGLEDAIIGGKRAVFSVQVEDNYTITIKNNYELLRETDLVGFKLYFNGNYAGHYTRDDEVIEYSGSSKNGLVEMELIPDEGAYWILSKMKIASDNDMYKNKNYVISKLTLGYPVIFESGDLKLYYIK